MWTEEEIDAAKTYAVTMTLCRDNPHMYFCARGKFDRLIREKGNTKNQLERGKWTVQIEGHTLTFPVYKT